MTLNCESNFGLVIDTWGGEQGVGLGGEWKGRDGRGEGVRRRRSQKGREKESGEEGRIGEEGEREGMSRVGEGRGEEKEEEENLEDERGKGVTSHFGDVLLPLSGRMIWRKEDSIKKNKFLLSFMCRVG